MGWVVVFKLGRLVFELGRIDAWIGRGVVAC